MLPILSQIDSLRKEVEAVYTTLVLPNWGKQLHGLPQTLYGYMMTVFSLIDVLSTYWKGDASARGQTERMFDFMSTYLSPHREANSVAIQMWRHKLMHTAQPRFLKNENTNKDYRWLLHWREHLPQEQHYTFVETGDSKILNIGLMYLIEDLKRAGGNYTEHLSLSGDLQDKQRLVDEQLNSYTYRDILHRNS